MSDPRVVIVGQRGFALARELLALGHIVQHLPSCRRLGAGLPAGEWDACVLVVDQLTAHDANLIRCAREERPRLAVLLLGANEATTRSLARLTGADGIIVPSQPRASARRIADAVARRRARVRVAAADGDDQGPTPAVRDAAAQRELAQLADRITHEIDNPATYVTANLTAVSESLSALAWDLRADKELSDRLDELDQTLREGLSGMARIRSITSDLRTVVRVEGLDEPEQQDEPRCSTSVDGSSTPSPASSQLRPRVTAPGAPSAHSQAPASRLRLLLIDDEPLVLRALRRMLTQHSVVIANGGAEALSKLASRSDYDLVFCDLMMPDIDGTEVYAAIQRRFPHLLDRLVFFTGGALTSRTRAFIEQSSQPLVHKPMTRSNFADIVTRVLARRVARRTGDAG
jgi:CheY-like chemotaxis protein